ncbi:hypothetical protein AYO22_11398 [Fonsecaea multimorphosa]|nr:hypothetical protein AYO22_11398 [Fonsecaea multimorphosa]
MSSTTKLGRLWAKNPPPENADACPPSKSSRWDSSRFRKFLSGDDKGPKDDSLQTSPVTRMLLPRPNTTQLLLWSNMMPLLLASLTTYGLERRRNLIIQAAEHNAALLKGLKSTSALICRLPIMEDVYLPTEPWSARPAHFDAFQEKFEESLTTLYSLVLEFQARALCYLKRVWAAQVLRDMAKLDTWEGLLMSIEKSEDALRSYTQLLDAEEMKRRFDEIRDAQENDVRFRITSTLDQKRVLGTCEWFTSHPRFHEWKNKGSGLLWVSADPGCGKSVLARYLVDEVVLSTSQSTTCYFFFKDDSEDQKTAANALCAILRQLFLEKPDLLQESILAEFQTKKDTHVSSFSDLWNTLLSVAADPNAGEIVCILDALDECQDRDRSRLIQALTELYSTNYLSNLKFLLTSRPYGHIGREFRELENLLPSIHLRGENDDEIQKISLEIDLVIRSRVEDIGNKWSLKQYERVFLHE